MKDINDEMRNISDKPENADELNMDDALKKMSMDHEPDFDTYIKKTINNRIKKIAAKTCITIIAAVIVIFFCISPLMNLCFTNAAKLNDGEDSTLLKTMRAYYETLYPYYEVCGIDVEKDGFGCYTLNMNVTDHTGLQIIGTTDVVMEMKLGKMSVKSDPEGRATFTLGRFDQNNKITQQELEQLYLDIEALPESAVIYASVSQKEAEDMFTLMEKTKDKVDLQWLQIYETESNFQAGVSLNLSCAYSDQDRRDDMDADDIRRIYIKNLETLRDNFDIWKDLGLYSVSSVYNSDNTEIIDDLLSEAKEHDLLESKNYCISGSRDEVLIYLQAWEAEWDNVQIDKVNYSKFG